jgi:hypothetical protein
MRTRRIRENVLIVVMIALVLCGCGKSEDKDNPSKKKVQKQEKRILHDISLPTQSLDFGLGVKILHSDQPPTADHANAQMAEVTVNVVDGKVSYEAHVPGGTVSVIQMFGKEPNIPLGRTIDIALLKSGSTTPIDIKSFTTDQVKQQDVSIILSQPDGSLPTGSYLLVVKDHNSTKGMLIHLRVGNEKEGK